MKLIVNFDYKEGRAHLNIDSESRTECDISMGRDGKEFRDEDYKWATAMIGNYVVGLLEEANPHKEKPKEQETP